MRVKIDIDNATIIRILLVAAAFVAVGMLFEKLWPILLLLAISFFLAIALNKPVSALARRLPGHSRPLATALSYVVFIVAISAFLMVAVPAIIKQTNIFIASLPGYIEQIGSQRGVMAEIVNRYQLQDEVNSFVQGVQSQAGALAKGIGTNVVAGVSSLLSGFLAIITVLVLTFLMLVEGPQILTKIWESYTDKSKLKRHQNLVSRMYRVVTGYVNGQVLVAGIASVIAALTLFILTMFFNLPASTVLPLAALVFVTSLIPLIGPLFGAVIILTVLAFNDLGAALVYLIYFVIYQQVETNVIQPTVQSRTVELSALTVIVSVITGVMLLGVLGGVLAIPIAGCVRVFVLDYVEHRRKQSEARAERRKTKGKLVSKEA